MTSTSRDNGKRDAELDKDFEDAIAFVKGKTKKLTRFTTTRYQVMDADLVKEVRQQLGLSQSAFATLLGASLSTVQAWEQGQRRPDGIATHLIAMLKVGPKEAVSLAAQADKWLKKHELVSA